MPSLLWKVTGLSEMISTWYFSRYSQLSHVDRRVLLHDDVIKCNHFPRYWPFVRGIHRFRWIPRTKSSDADLLCFFLWLRLNKPLSKQWWGWWFGTLSRPLWRHCNVHDRPVKWIGAIVTEQADRFSQNSWSLEASRLRFRIFNCSKIYNHNATAQNTTMRCVFCGKLCGVRNFKNTLLSLTRSHYTVYLDTRNS